MATLIRDGEVPQTFHEAQERQDRLHRRRPELKIHGAAQARVMVQELGMVSVNAATELPNLVDPIIGRRASGAERVYTEPATVLKGWLPSILADADIIQLKLFRQEATLVVRQLWPQVHPVARHFGGQGRDAELLSPMGRKFLGVLDRQGPMRLDRLKKELGVRTVGDSKAFKLAREELENYCLIVSWDDPANPKDSQGVIWETCDRFASRNVDARLVPRSLEESWAGLAQAALRAAVMAPEKGVARWFPWDRSTARTALEHLLSRGAATRIAAQKEIWILSRS
ncbi:MAG: hypothetical protein HY815_04200 [Candidatus Riflebacteria bacterium]|nr:hypothetical protein [Candidatus Riflebacteria bacterium]